MSKHGFLSASVENITSSFLLLSISVRGIVLYD